MKTLLLSMVMFFPNALAHAYQTHEQIVKSMSANKPGITPQFACKNKACGPHPKYNKLREVLPKADRAKKKKHDRKGNYSKHGEKR